MMIRDVLAEYGGFNAAMKKGAELESLPEARVTEGVSIDGYSTWRAVWFSAPLWLSPVNRPARAERGKKAGPFEHPRRPIHGSAVSRQLGEVFLTVARKTYILETITTRVVHGLVGAAWENKAMVRNPGLRIENRNNGH